LLKGILTSTFSAMCYASGVIFVRWAYAAGITPASAVFLRFFLAALLLAPVVHFFIGHHPTAKIQRRVLFVLGFFLYTIMGAAWFTALQLSPAWLVSLFTAVYPLSVGVGSWLILREPFHIALLPSLAAVVAGGFLLFWQPVDTAGLAQQNVLAGSLLMLLNIAAYTAFILLGRRWIAPDAPEESVFWLVAGAAAGSGCYALLAGGISLDFQPIGWLWVVSFAVFATLLSTIFLWRGIRLLGTARAAIVGAFEPVFAILFSLVVLGERLAPLQVAGGLLVLAGVGWLHWSGRHL
jgi:drug/metabolite transporter (DMT)-like permease